MFLLNLQSKVPINVQIQEQILKFIQTGVLKPGDKLPSVRQLASENGINPNTVARAYTELEKNGYVYNLPKKGVYVAEKELSAPADPVRNALRQLKEQGVTKSELLAKIEELYREEDHAED